MAKTATKTSKVGNLAGLSALAKQVTSSNRREVLTVPLDEVVSKEQVRKKFKKIDELAASMETEGQQSPIIVYPKNAEGKFVIQKGERRWRALKESSLDTIDIIVNHKEQTDLDEVAGELVENIQRDDLEPMEVANALNAFLEDGWSQLEITDRIGKSRSYVSTHLSLLKLPPHLLDLYDREITKDIETLNNLRLLNNLNEERCLKVCELIIRDQGITRKQSRELLNDAKRVREEAKKPKPAPSQTAGSQAEPQVKQEPAAEKPKRGRKEEQQSFLDRLAEESEKAEGHTNAPETDEPAQTGSPQQAIPTATQKGTAAPQIQAEANDWAAADPKGVVIAVEVKTDADSKRGMLMLDRIAKDPSEVWVKIHNAGKEMELCVKASDVTLISVEA